MNQLAYKAEARNPCQARENARQEVWFAPDWLKYLEVFSDWLQHLHVVFELETAVETLALFPQTSTHVIAILRDGKHLTNSE